MMNCPQCGSDIKTVPAGISKKTGKPYNEFQVCSNRECGWKPGIPQEIPRNENFYTKPPEPKPNGHNADMRLSYRKDLMCSIVNRLDDVSNTELAINIFTDLWREIEQ